MKSLFQMCGTYLMLESVKSILSNGDYELLLCSHIVLYFFQTVNSDIQYILFYQPKMEHYWVKDFPKLFSGLLIISVIILKKIEVELRTLL